MSKLTVIDLFSGCGGMSLGFELAGFKVLLGIDNWHDAISTFKLNHSNSLALVENLEYINPNDIAERTGIYSVDVIIGGPPCQGFSIAGKRIVNDERNSLYKSFVNFVHYYKPKAFIMENVPNILSMENGTVRDSIIADFENIGYNVVFKTLLASDFGVPQNRKRAFFVGLLNGKSFAFPEPNVSKIKITAQEAISDLPIHSLEDGNSYVNEAKSVYQKQMRLNSYGVFNHQITQHNSKTIEIIALVPDGGNYKDLPLELQSTRKVKIAWTRLNSKKPSFTIDTGHRHHFHYLYNRIPTVRESARIQSFPDTFVFLGSKTSQYKQVGNAVPPLLSKAIATELKDHLYAK